LKSIGKVECYDVGIMSNNVPDEAWRIPPELEQPLPRRIRLNGTGIFNCVMAAVSLVFGLGLAGRVIHDELRREAESESLVRRLATEGRETQATVTKLFTGMGYVVNYKYTVDGRSHEGGAFISSEHWQSLQVGSALAVRYLPSDPAEAYPDSDPPNLQKHWSITLPLAGMILLFMFSFTAIYLSAPLPQRRLLARGSAARGTVARCKEGSKGRMSGYFLYYDFALPDGGQCQGKAFRREPMQEGSVVTVLYHPDRPRRNGLYPLPMVRLAAP
jgi:hypothetical protein